MKKLLLAAAACAALAVGAVAYFHPTSTVLECKTTDVSKNSYDLAHPKTENTSWLFELLPGSQWRVISINGLSLKTLADVSSKNDFNKLSFVKTMRVTADSYVLLDERNKDDGKYISSNMWTINRETGDILIVTNTSEKGQSSSSLPSFWSSTEATGHCAPYTYPAKL
jgi:hypothetical protein